MRPWFNVLILAVGIMAPEATAAPTSVPDYMIVVTGDELLAGAYPDGHTAFLTRTLLPMGFRCVRSTIVDDSRAEIQAALREATAKVPLVIVTGGLGPTENDVTRPALAEFTNIPLAESREVLAEFERRFKQPPRGLRPNLRRQALVPTRGTFLKNDGGTAVGLVFEMPQAVVVALPGPPRELQPMVLHELVPYLTRRYGTRRPALSVGLRFVGVGQSQISHVLDEHLHLAPDILVGSAFEGSRVDFTFSLRDETPENRARLETLKQQILKELGEYVYADDATSLEEHVCRLLIAKHQRLTIAEAGSGGSLAAALAGAEHAPPVLDGAHVASSEQQLRSLLRVAEGDWAAAHSSAQRLGLLAAAAARDTGAQWAVAVGELHLDAAGNRSVEVAFRRPDGQVDLQRLSPRGTGELARANLATQLLDQLRRRLK
jgi:nicotinamide-nucleotide amidase